MSKNKIRFKKKSFLKWAFLFAASVLMGLLFISPANQSKLFPGLRRMSYVDKPEKYILQQIQKCQEIQKSDIRRYDCLHSLGQILTEQISFKDIVQVFNSSNIDCHDLMHNIVNAQYKKGAKIQEIWEQCSSACDRACYHGGLEALISDGILRSEEDLEDSIEKLCDPIKDKFSELYYQCFHGVGHAFMLMTNGDLPQSLIFCDKISEPGLRTNCYGGAFMENLPSTKSSNHIKTFTKEEDPLYPCNAINKKYQYTCYSFHPSYFLYISNGNLSQVIEHCASVPSDYRGSCYLQVGIMGIKHNNYDSSNAVDVCRLIPEEKQIDNCIKGLVIGYGEQFPKNFQALEDGGILEFCDKLNADFRNICSSQAEIIRQEIEDKSFDKARECAGIENVQDKRLCLGIE